MHRSLASIFQQSPVNLINLTFKICFDDIQKPLPFLKSPETSTFQIPKTKTEAAFHEWAYVYGSRPLAPKLAGVFTNWRSRTIHLSIRIF